MGTSLIPQVARSRKLVVFHHLVGCTLLGSSPSVTTARGRGVQAIADGAAAHTGVQACLHVQTGWFHASASSGSLEPRPMYRMNLSDENLSSGCLPLQPLHHISLITRARTHYQFALWFSNRMKQFISVLGSVRSADCIHTSITQFGNNIYSWMD
jgi:hypothetical protein